MNMQISLVELLKVLMFNFLPFWLILLYISRGCFGDHDAVFCSVCGFKVLLVAVWLDDSLVTFYLFIYLFSEKKLK